MIPFMSKLANLCTPIALMIYVIGGSLFMESCNSFSDQADHRILETNSERLDSATLLAPNVISSTLPEFATSLSKDGKEMFFNRTSEDRSEMRIYRSIRTSQGWQLPEVLPFSKGEYVDVDPFITSGGEKLYFSSNRPTERGAGVFNHWFVERMPHGWSAPVLAAPPLNSDSSDIYFTQAANGNSYFRSGRRGGRKLFRSVWQDGAFQEPIPIQLKMKDTIVFASNPCISSDEKFLIVFSFSPEDPSNADLFVAWNTQTGWSDLQNLGPKVNSPYTEFAPSLSKDDQILFFTSERPGVITAQTEAEARPPGDLYQIRLVNTIPGFIDPTVTEEVTFATDDGVKIYGDLHLADRQSPLVMLFHQGGTNARGEYAPITAKLTQKGFNVLAIDQRLGGETYGYFNRTVANMDSASSNYCDAILDMEAALDFALSLGFEDVILWGSSYSGSLAIQLAHKRAKSILGTLAFSPASGGPMADCLPNSFLKTLEKPLLIVRPQREMNIESVQEQFNLAQRHGHQLYIAAPGIHGSSTLIEERVGKSTTDHWGHILSFLRGLSDE